MPRPFAARRPILVLLALAIPLAAARGARAEDVRAAIEASNRAFVGGFLRGDSAALAGLYAEDAKVIAPGAPVAAGHAAIAAFWKGVIDSGVKDVKLTTLDVEAAGDLASETGVVRLVAADGKASEERYVVVWKRVGGAWKLYRDIWN
jgi:ketosteroid isomerase-like protein